MTCRECIHFEVCGKATLKLEVCEYGGCRYFDKKPPVKIGDSMYYVGEDEGRYIIEELTVAEVGVNHVFFSAFNPPEEEDYSENFPLEEIGEIFFLTREDAEDMVRKLKKKAEERGSREETKVNGA